MVSCLSYRNNLETNKDETVIPEVTDVRDRKA